jgi:hypothetical protein
MFPESSLFPSAICCINVKIKIYKTVIVAVVRYGCETWSQALWEKRRLRVIENRVPSTIFSPKRGEII